MNAAFQIAQLNYDRALPPEDDGRDEAVSGWLAESAEQLVRHQSDVMFKPRFGPLRGVTFAQYLTALQDHLNQLQKDGADQEDWFAQLVLGNAYGYASPSVAGYLVGTGNPRGKLFEIAEALLEPFADDALLARAGDDLL